MRDRRVADQSWVLTTSYGRESARTVVECFAVCAACPVRTACLADAVNESSWSVMGVWGGSVMSERTRAVRTARRQDPDATEADIRERAALELEATFESRLAIWEHMAHGGTRRPATKRTVALRRGLDVSRPAGFTGSAGRTVSIGRPTRCV